MSHASESAHRRIAFEPGLEGLRGFALLGMLCFHAEFEWARGGFLPIPTFFTLSGYLITSLFLVEWQRTSTISLRTFWTRRLRRLMPAALLTLALMSVFGAFAATAEQLATLRRDVLWALLYAANWNFIFSDVAYANLFSAPSPVQHFWSLAIEEQFYFLFPLIVAATLRMTSGSRNGLGAVFAALTFVSIGLSIILTNSGASRDRVYYGSDTRAAELLVGALLATILYGREIASRRVVNAIHAVGIVAMLAMVALWTSVDLLSPWLYRGGFAAYSLLSAAAIASAVQPGGPVRAFLSLSPIRYVGRVSYGAYLFHWPLYLWLSPEGTGLDVWPLFALRVATTFALAAICYEFLESPIRDGRWLRGRQALWVAPLAVLVILGGVHRVTSLEAQRALGDVTPEMVEAMTRFATGFKPTDAPADVQPVRDRAVPRVATYGDSTAAVIGISLAYWLHETERGVPLLGVAELGCGLLSEGEYRFRGLPMQRPNHCTVRRDSWSSSVARVRPDIAVVSFGPWEVCDRRFAPDTEWTNIGEPSFDTRIEQEMLEAVDLLSAGGTLVVWLTYPTMEVRQVGTNLKLPRALPESDPARMARLNELIRALETKRPGRVRVVDLAAYLRSLPGGELDPGYRPDGIHFDARGALKVTRDWFGEQVLRVYRESD